MTIYDSGTCAQTWHLQEFSLYIYIYTHTYICIHAHIDILILVSICIYTDTYIDKKCTNCMCICVCIYKYLHTYICSDVYTYLTMRINTYMAVSTILSPSIVSNRTLPYRTESQHLHQTEPTSHPLPLATSHPSSHFCNSPTTCHLPPANPPPTSPATSHLPPPTSPPATTPPWEVGGWEAGGSTKPHRTDRPFPEANHRQRQPYRTGRNTHVN